MTLEVPASRDAFERACRVMPGGVNSPVRAFRAVGGVPLFFERGAGAHLYDVDGHAYIDYVCSWGPLILGHAHPRVVAAVQEAAARGTSFGAPNLAELRLAELIVAAVPSVEKVRLVNSGTEATMSALRLARAYTGRSRIVKFAGCYHGHVDSLLVQAGSGATTLGVPDSPGVTPAVAGETLLAPYNDLAEVEALFDAHGKEIAAVIVEPIAGNMGLVPPKPGFLEGLRALTARHGALLIFDEVITGFRVSYGGAQALYGVQPDLTCLGKIIGGGMPIGAYGGRADIMEMVAPAGPVYQAGTLSGNPLAAAVGVATLEALQEEGVYQRLDQAGRRLAEGLSAAARAAGVPVQVTQIGSCVCVFFADEPVVDYASARRADVRRYAAFFHKMLARGVYLPPAQFETMFVSLAHRDEDLERTLAAAGEAFAELAREQAEAH